MIATAHQPNFAPGASIVHKIRNSDVTIWLDEVQYTKGGWTNRQKMPDGSWLTIPIDKDTDGLPLNRVRLTTDDGWRWKTNRTLRQHYGEALWLPRILAEIHRPYQLLVGLNLGLLRVIFHELGGAPPWVFQSHLDSGHAVTAVSEDAALLAPISERLAMMCREVGATTYLSGPSGRDYLDEQPFKTRGIKVRYWAYDGPQDCAFSVLPRARLLAA